MVSSLCAQTLKSLYKIRGCVCNGSVAVSSLCSHLSGRLSCVIPKLRDRDRPFSLPTGKQFCRYTTTPRFLTLYPHRRQTGPSPGSQGLSSSTCCACSSPASHQRGINYRSDTSCASVSRTAESLCFSRILSWACLYVFTGFPQPFILYGNHEVIFGH